MAPKLPPNPQKVLLLVVRSLTNGDLLADPVPEGLRIDFGAQKVNSLGSKSDPLASKSDPLTSKSGPLDSINDPQTKKNYPLESRSYPQTPNDHFEILKRFINFFVSL